MHNLCFFCTFSTFVQKIFNGLVWKRWCAANQWGRCLWQAELVINYAWFYAFFKILLFKNYFWQKILFAEINLTTRGPLYTCLVQTYFQPLDNISDVRNVGVISKETSYGGSDFLKILKKGDWKFAARKGDAKKEEINDRSWIYILVTTNLKTI